ncbi:C-X-C chemokine receptor type 3-2 [Xyrichtys novacula]|uniref:C-X-C chemokine receptor type 3-2 n=1 Tax=Xyrichtys novacula TaxID=13765 RepID=A0AAV1FMG1_XYRNO|nr:C-X-C chemokine receptor type 3-2 [Xyrichtys novacula]
MSMEVDLHGLFENFSYNYKDYVYIEDPEDPESGGGTAVFISVLYSLAVAVGLFGNGLLLVILFLKRRSWSVSDTLILHLSVSDVLLLLTLPFWAAQAALLDGWCFGGFLCKLSGALFNINFYCGIFLLSCACLDRYLSIIHGIQSYFQEKPKLVPLTCLFVWVIPLILTIPDWVFMVAAKHSKQEKTQCVHNYSYFGTDQKLVYRLPHHILGFLLPTAILFISCSCILLRLQRSSEVLRTQRAFFKIILPLVVAFLLCWMPYNITLIVDTIRDSSRELGVLQPGHESLETALMATKVLGCIHACLRPLLYFGLCGKFRKRALTLLGCGEVEQEGSLWELGVGKEAPPEQNHNEREELKQMMTTMTDHQVQSAQC